MCSPNLWLLQNLNQGLAACNALAELDTVPPSIGKEQSIWKIPGRH